MARPEGKIDVRPTSIRFPVAIDNLWIATAKKMNLSKSAVLIIALRNLAKAEGVTEADAAEKEAAAA